MAKILKRIFGYQGNESDPRYKIMCVYKDTLENVMRNAKGQVGRASQSAIKCIEEDMMFGPTEVTKEARAKLGEGVNYNVYVKDIKMLKPTQFIKFKNYLTDL